MLYILCETTVQTGVPDFSVCDGPPRLGSKRKENINVLFLSGVYTCKGWGKAIADMKDSGPTCAKCDP